MASGRAIHPFYVELRQLVTEIEDVDIYDDDLSEALFVADDDDKVGTLKRPEADAILLKATIDMQDFEGLAQVATGNVPSTNLKFFAHKRDLQRAGLLDGTGGISIRVNDRVSRLLDRFKRPAVSFDRVPVYVTEVRPAVLEGGMNFWQVALDVREQGARV